MKYIHKIGVTFLIMLFALLSISCEWPFNTKPTENDVFELTVKHNITRLMPSANINLTWSEITVEQFTMYKIERMRTQDTSWTPIVDLSNAFQLSYTDTIWDDENLIYRIGIIDLEDNVLWATESISIPKTTEVYVPNEFQTIQPAFESELVDDGDTIIVSPGIYLETLGIAGKDVLIRSVEGFKTTILQPTYADPPNERVMNISSGIVDGFTIELGSPSFGAAGGGVAMTQNGTVKNCYITTNQSEYGGGVFLTDDGSLYNNIIHNNIGANGGGMYITDAHGEIINNTLVQNDIVINGDCTGLIIRNNIIYQSQPDISYTNSALQTGIIIDFNLLDENINVGSDYINEDPEFLDNIDFRLSPTSPCIDAGHDDNQYLDIDGSRN
ncbi:MAG: hypothetical protein DRQ01_01170, partial [Ignavibacteriae bacterium]